MVAAVAIKQEDWFYDRYGIDPSVDVIQLPGKAVKLDAQLREHLDRFKLTSDQERALRSLASDATHNALGGGSRSGKTFLCVRAILYRAIKAPGSRHLICRFRFNSVKTSVGMDTLPKVLQLCFPDLPPLEEMLDKTDWFIKLPNGSEIWMTGLDDDIRVEKVLGHEYATIFFNECSQIPWKSVELALTRLAQKTSLKLKAYYDLNPPSKKHWSYLRFIEKRECEPPYHYVEDEFDYTYNQLNPEGNKENLAEGYLDQLKKLGARARRRFLLGQFADVTEGQLWTEELLDQQRVLATVNDSLPQWMRIVIAVDPSGSKGKEDERSDEIGIVVVALGENGKAYLLEDLTTKGSPELWGQIVCDAYERHEANMVVGETNFGGDMVRSVVQAKNPDLPFKAVRASLGKHIRAEPVSTLYETGKAFHVGYFQDLENEMIAMLASGYTGPRSPNRLDAVVFAMMELFPGLTKKSKRPLQETKVNVAPRSGRSHAYAGSTNVRVNTRTRRRRH